MTTISDHGRCERCGYNFGDSWFDCDTNEWEFSCHRCGYAEFHQQLKDDAGNPYGWRNEQIDAFGVWWATAPSGRHLDFVRLNSEQDVEQAELRMMDRIVKGELDREQSYVTRWDSRTKRVAIVAGRWCHTGGLDF